MENDMAANCSNYSDHHIPSKIFTPLGSYGVTAFVTYAMPIVIIIGIVGNILTFQILKYAARISPYYFFLRCLAVFDSLSLLSIIPSFWMVLVLRPYYHYTNSGQTWIERHLMTWYSCQTRLFLTFLFRTMSIWTIVVFSIFRCIANNPRTTQRLCNHRSAKIALATLSIVALLVNIPWFFTFDKHQVQSSNSCAPSRTICRGNRVLFINRMIEFSFFSIIPAIIIIITNFLTVRTLRRAARDAGRYRKQVQHQVTRHMIAVSAAFVILTSPSLIIISQHTVSEFTGNRSHRSGTLADVFHIAMLLFTLNLAINFFLYCLVAPQFRQSLFFFFRGRQGDMERLASHMTSDEDSTEPPVIIFNNAGDDEVLFSRNDEEEAKPMMV